MKAQADALNFIHWSDPSPQAMHSRPGAGKGFSHSSERKTASAKQSAKMREPPSKSRSGLGPGLEHRADQLAEDRRVSGERARRAAEIISECSRLGLWEAARRVYDLVAADLDGSGPRGSGALGCLSLGQFRAEALSVLGETMSAATRPEQEPTPA